MNSILRAYQQLKSKAVGSKERVEGAISPAVEKDITDAINNHYQLNILYLGDSTSKPGYYYIIPMVWGLNKFTKNNILRAYVLEGGDYWVTFRLDRIRQTFITKSKTFDKAPPGYNPSGDGLMSEELLKVTFPKIP